MPGRLVKIFDRKQTKVEDRYACIADCCYTNSVLDAAEKVSLFSSKSYVADAEGLARIMECPNSILATGVFHAMAFQESMKRGLSTQRIMLTTSDKIHEFGKHKAALFNKTHADRPREYLGYIVGTAGEVRKLSNSNGDRLFGVFATPENDPAHADIFLVTRIDEGDKLHIQRLFHRIFKVAGMVAAPT